MNAYDNFVKKELSDGVAPVNIAKSLVKNFSDITYNETAQAIHFLVNKEVNPKVAALFNTVSYRLTADGKSVPDDSNIKEETIQENSDVEDAIYFAWLMKVAYPDSTALEIAQTVKQYYTLDAGDMAKVIKNGGEYPVFPNISAKDMVDMLKAPSLEYSLSVDNLKLILKDVGYTQAEIDALFPKPSNPRTVDPFGNRSGNFVNDWPTAKGKGPIVKMTVNSGDIVDGFQAFYKDGSLAYHGGERGGRDEFTLDSGDYLVEMSGYYGYWFGRNYVLQVTFKSKNGKVYGPFGSMKYASTRNPFSCEAKSGEQIVALSNYQVRGLEADGSTTYYVTAMGLTFDTI